jgi:hypothetical protein
LTPKYALVDEGTNAFTDAVQNNNQNLGACHLKQKERQNMKIKTSNQSAGVSACLGLALAATVCTTSLPVQAALPDVTADYNIKTVQPPDGTTGIMNLFMNDNGMVVIMYCTPTTVGCGDMAIWEDGAWKELLAPMPRPAARGTLSLYTTPTCPNAFGQMALCFNNPVINGAAAGGICLCHHAIYDEGKYTYIGGYPYYHTRDGQKWYWCISQAMNDLGVITCLAWGEQTVDALGGTHSRGLLLNASLSLFELFDPPGSATTWPAGINDAGMVVGEYFHYTGTEPWQTSANPWEGTWHGFLRDTCETYVDLDVPGYPGLTTPLFINNEGETCGIYGTPYWTGDLWAPGVQGFLLRNGEFSSFNVPGSSWTYLDVITDSGKLAGAYADQSGNLYGFIATPKCGRK